MELDLADLESPQQGENPLERFRKKPPQPPTTNPLEQFRLAKPEQPQGEEGPDLLLTAQANRQNIQDNLTKLKTLRAATIDPQRQATLDRLIASFEAQLGGGIGAAFGV